MAGEYRGSENTHWYASAETVAMGVATYVGEPIEFVPGAKGQPIKATLREARKYHLKQGATAVMGMLNKPQLYDWGSKMTADGAVTPVELEGYQGIPASDFLGGLIDRDRYRDLCLRARDMIGKKAAAGGTELHKYVELGVQGVPQEGVGAQVWAVVENALHENWPGIIWKAELPAVHPLGFGCRTDLLGFEETNPTEPIVCVDVKTREFNHDDVVKAGEASRRNQVSLGRLTPRDTEPMQVAANLKAHNNDIKFFDGCGGNLYLSRNTADCVFVVKYTAKKLDEAWLCFTSLNTVYKTLKGLP